MAISATETKSKKVACHYSEAEGCPWRWSVPMTATRSLDLTSPKVCKCNMEVSKYAGSAESVSPLFFLLEETGEISHTPAQPVSKRGQLLEGLRTGVSFSTRNLSGDLTLCR